MTPNFRNPFLWLSRIRKRCGYGVHSPFAFGFLENVVYESRHFYAYQELEQGFRWHQKFRQQRYLRLLFRLVNYHHPSLIVLHKAHPLEEVYLTKARYQADASDACIVAGLDALIERNGAENVFAGKCLFFLSEPDEKVLECLTSDSMLVLANVHRYKDWWQSLPSVVSFDLYDLGIAFFDTQYNKQEYIVNF